MSTTNQTIIESSPIGRWRIHEEDFVPEYDMNEELIILSIHRQYADRIKDGSKTVELRRKFGNHLEGYYAVVYVPKEKVVTNLLRIGTVHTGRSDHIWTMYSHRMGIAQADYAEYTSGYYHVKAVEIQSCGLWGDDIPFDDIRERNAPQNYRYMTWDECARLDSILTDKERPIRFYHPVFLPPDRRAEDVRYNPADPIPSTAVDWAMSQA